MKASLFALLLCGLAAPAFAQWTRIDTNGLPRAGNIAVSSVSASEVAVYATAGNPSGLYRSTDHGATWTRVTAVPTGPSAGATVAASGASVLVQDGSTSVYVSTDHGVTWAARPRVPSLEAAVNGFARVQTTAGRSHAFISATSSLPNKLFVTHDDFATVTAVLPGETIEQVTTSGTVLLASSGFSNTARYFRSTDGGRTWTQTASPNVATPSIFGASDSLFVAGSFAASSLYGSKDGAAWTALPGGQGIAAPVEADPSHSAVFAYTGSSFTLSVRNGRAPQGITGNFPVQTFGTLRLICHQTGGGLNRAVTSRFAYAVSTCDDAGQSVTALYRHPVVGARTTAVEHPARAGTLALGAPAPNPARGGFSVAFAQEAAGAVRLVLVDLLGRTVATLVDGPHPAGETTATLGADALPAGVYLLRLMAGAQVVSRPVVIAR